jgi:hypothetical protein
VNWIPVTEEEARLHPFYGFGGWLLVVYGIEAVLFVFSLYQTVSIGLRYGVDIYANPGFAVVWLQLALNLPFLIMAPLKARGTPLVAIICFWVGMLSGIGNFVMMPPPMMAGIRFIVPMLFALAWGTVLTVYLLRSRRVNVTYRHRVRAGEPGIAGI